MRRTLFLSLLINLSVLTSVAYGAPGNDAIEQKIDSLLQQLTLEEKVGLCHAQSKFSSAGVARLGIPELWMSDGPHGVRAEINWDDWGYAGWTNDSITAFPALTCLAASFNPQLAYAYGFALGEEALYREKDVLLGPGVNIYRTPLNGRNFEYMGEDPYLASVMAVPYIKGVQKNGVAACLKHYALNNQEKWRDQISVEVSDRALHEIYLPAFKAAVQEGGVWSIMGSYNKYYGQYCCHNEVLLNQILKGDWEFDGTVISDWSGTHDTREAALYGLDIEMGTGTDGLSYTEKNAYNNYYLAKPFYDKIQSGELDEALVDDKARRILRMMYRTNMNPNRGFGKLNTQEHLDVAREVGTQGMVLLKNENEFFPVQDAEGVTIAVIGENATRPMTIGGGSSELKAKKEVSPLEGLESRYSKARIVHSMGYSSGPSAYGKVRPTQLNQDSLFKAALQVATQADVVLFIGGLNKSYEQDCEGGDRVHYNLPFQQDKLLSEIAKVNANVGLVLVSGNAVEMPWIDQVKGILQAWYLGSQAGNAIADVVSGDVNPSGKLPFSFPVKLADNSAHYYGEISYPGDGVKQLYKEGIFVGYRWHEAKKIKPQFAFGYGLSYTSFELNNIEIDQKKVNEKQTITVKCTVQNTGSVAGAEVVQVYVGKPKSKVERAVKELKGFQKVSLMPGENKEVSISVEAADLAFYNEAVGDWEVEKGSYYVYVGNASNNITQKVKFTIE